VRRKEVLAFAIAYCAVLVVFIGILQTRQLPPSKSIMPAS
jgi:hypothetical protein